MNIDGFRLPKIPFLILDLGNQDVILGDAWMAHFDVLPDLRYKKLFCRSPPEMKPSFQRQLVIPRNYVQPSFVSQIHQADADRRDKAIYHDEKRAADGHKSSIKARICGSEVNVLDKEVELTLKIPQRYHTFLDVFSKNASDSLAPRRSYDHKILLESDSKIGYGPLYNQSLEELQLIKQYIIENPKK